MGWTEFVASWAEACRRNTEWDAFYTDAEFAFLVRSGGDEVLIRVSRREPWSWSTAPSADDAWQFSLSAPVAVWTEFWRPVPRPPYHNLLAMMARVPDFRVDGDRRVFFQHAYLVRRILETGRAVMNGAPPAPAPGAAEAAAAPWIEPITGRYVHVPFRGQDLRIYYEEAGTGQDLLCLHTAGSDGRQFRALLNDPDVTREWHVVAFDLPWHGKSLPPEPWYPGAYRLDTDTYAGVIDAFMNAVGLVRPVVLGSSMAGEICLELAYRWPERLGGVIACEAADRVPGRQVAWSKHPEVNAAAFVPEWVYGLMAPHSPRKDEVWWEYSQGGHGLFHGDIAFYSGDWDARDRVSRIDTARCPVYMLTGEYDYSCTPEMSRRTAERIPGAQFQEMKGLGHFPMTENPERFREYLLPILAELKARAREGRA